MRNPYKNFVPLVADNDTDIPEVSAIYVGEPGTLIVMDAEGDKVTFTVEVSPFILPICPKRIIEDSTITELVGLR